MISSRESRDLNPDPLVSRASALTTRLRSSGALPRLEGLQGPRVRLKDPDSRRPGMAGTLPSAPLSPSQRAWLCEQCSVAEVGARLEAPIPPTQATASKLLQIMGLFAQEIEEAVNSRQSN